MVAHQPVEAVEILPHVSRARRKVDPRRRSKAEHDYNLSSTLTSSARASASKPLPTSTFRPLDNNTVRALCCFPVATEADTAASSTAISRLSPVMLFPLDRCSPDCFFRCRASVLKAIRSEEHTSEL